MLDDDVEDDDDEITRGSEFELSVRKEKTSE